MLRTRPATVDDYFREDVGMLRVRYRALGGWLTVHYRPVSRVNLLTRSPRISVSFRPERGDRTELEALVGRAEVDNRRCFEAVFEQVPRFSDLTVFVAGERLRTISAYDLLVVPFNTVDVAVMYRD